MANKHDLFGISDFKYGAPGDGVMGTVLVSMKDIQDGSVKITYPQPEIVDIYTETEEGTPYKSIPKQSKGLSIEVSLYGVDLSKYPDFFGGTWDNTNKEWKMPKSLANIYKSVRIETKATDADGTKIQIDLASALITSSIEGSLTKDSIAAVKLVLTAQVPVSAAGVKGDPVVFREI